MVRISRSERTSKNMNLKSVNIRSRAKKIPIVFSVYWMIRKIETVIKCTFLKSKSHTYLYEGSCIQKRGRIVKNNWGDDLDQYFFEYVTECDFYVFPFSAIKKPPVHYLTIGSILNFYNLNNTIIYGSGIINPLAEIKGKPQKIISVRGPLTRNVLLSNGIECPEAYGDPALLLPLFYCPKLQKQYKYGFIPNTGTDIKAINSDVKEWIEEEDNILIEMNHYDQWTDVIDMINQCEYIVSESLHGLIVGETYEIPSIWIEFIDHPSYWDFKYKDFYMSINKEVTKRELKTKSNINSVKNELREWQPSIINQESLLKLFPFPINRSLC